MLVQFLQYYLWCEAIWKIHTEYINFQSFDFDTRASKIYSIQYIYTRYAYISGIHIVKVISRWNLVFVPLLLFQRRLITFLVCFRTRGTRNARRVLSMCFCVSIKRIRNGTENMANKSALALGERGRKERNQCTENNDWCVNTCRHCIFVTKSYLKSP